MQQATKLTFDQLDWARLSSEIASKAHGHIASAILCSSQDMHGAALSHLLQAAECLDQAHYRIKKALDIST